MSIWRLIVREIGFRKLNFTLALLSVIVAVGAGLSMRAGLRHFTAHAEREMAASHERRIESAKSLEDHLRKVTKDLGFNIRILPESTNLGKLESTGEIDSDMPEEYVSKLANTDIVSINHLLPIIQERVDWPGLEFPVLVVGTRGEVAQKDRDQKKPLLDLVPRGKIILGYRVAEALSKPHGKPLYKGSSVTLKGSELLVEKIHKQRGNRDDATVFINLTQAQEMFDKKGRINAILALGCNCEADRLTVIRRDIEKFLPETIVDEETVKADARARARLDAAKRARAEDIAVKKERTEQIRGREALSAWVIPLVVIVCVTWLGVIVLLNVRERRDEIGIFRALGLRSMQVLWLFLGKAFLIGLIGAVLGIGVGLLLGYWISAGDLSLVIEPMLLLGVALAAPVLCVLAGWLPALLAARQDPAVILREN